MNGNAAGASPVERRVRPTLLTEKELLEIVDQILRDKAYNRPAAVQIAMAVGSAVEAEVRQRVLAAVEQRIRGWRQRTMNKSGDRLAIDDFMGQESIDDLVDCVCDEWA
jgi:hypothetical protein